MKIYNVVLSTFLFIISVFSSNFKAIKNDIAFTESIIKGRVLDQNNFPIPYVNIGIVNGVLGTVSDKDGNFTLKLADTDSPNSIVRFSAIGYSDFNISFKEFSKKIDAEYHLIKEEAIRTSNIEEVKIAKIGRSKLKKFGITSSTKSVRGGFTNAVLGQEIATYVKNGKKIKLTQLNINVLESTFDKTPFRVKFYSIDENGNYINLLDENIYVNIDKSSGVQKISVDLAPYHILVNTDFIISLELIENKENGRLYFSGSIFSKGLIRRTSQSKFQETFVNPSFSVDALIY